jgi:serine phosphatase RsbU (regulator of sigma subunit)
VQTEKNSEDLVNGVMPEEFSRSAGPRLQCLEVFGGNNAIDTSIETMGLDVWARLKPYDGAGHGGDVLYVSACSSGRVTRALLADVMGHGPSAAEAADRLRAVVRRTIDAVGHGQLVRELNNEFAQVEESSRFASALALSYFRTTNRMSICNAGHPAPLVYRAEKKRWQILDIESDGGVPKRPMNLPLGLFSWVDYEVYDVEIGEQDLLLLYTDGVLEVQDELGRELGIDGLLEFLNEPARLTRAAEACGEVIPGIMECVEGWTAGPLEDDVSMLLLRRNAQSSTLMQDVGAPFRYLKHRVNLLKS